MGQVYIATATKVVRRDGQRVRITADVSRADGDHWLVTEYPDLWKPIDVHFGVHEATAVPGEPRGHVCDVCGQSAKTAAGLGAHKRSHD